MDYSPCYDAYYGRKVRISGSNIKWAEGETGVIKEIKMNNILGGIDELDQAQARITVELDDMDKSIPPYGLVTVDSDEIEFIPDEPKIEGDPVNHPSHYTDGKYEVIDYIESKGYNSNFYLANAVKYLSRAGKKDPAKKQEDVDKAVWYLKRMQQNDKAKWMCQSISVDEFIKDKGLENTAQGVALSLIDDNKIDLAIKVLTMQV